MQLKYRLWIVLVCALIILSASACMAKTIYVKTTGLDTNDGLSWDTAKKTVAAGITTSVSGDEIWVAAGTYVERIGLRVGAGLYGGFAGTETLRTQRNWSTNVTILDGNQGGFVVMAPPNATITTVIDGFTIRNGKSSGSGGGITCSGSSSPTISNNTITANTASSGGGIACGGSATVTGNTITANTAFSGGGIYGYDYSSPTISNNTITANTASYGGGIYCAYSSTLTIRGNSITGNNAFYSGGGIYGLNSTVTVTNNAITANSASDRGGGIYCEYSSCTITNNAITGNSATNYGGGIYCCAYSPVIANNVITANGAESGGGLCCNRITGSITNNTITGNNAYRNSGGIYFFSGSPSVSNNIIAFNSSGMCNYDVTGTPILKNNCVYNPDGTNYTGLTAGTGDISADPKLVAVEYGKVHMQPTSPCRNAGLDSAVQSGWLDMDGQARIQGTHVDIGADESNGYTWTYAPAVVRVSQTGNDANDGSSWFLAKRTVQAGAFAASPVGGEVWVAAGTYNERIVLPAYAYLYGGFSGTEGSKSQRNCKINIAVLDGGKLGTVVRAQTGSKITASGIDGFTITNGSAIYAGGIYCYHSSPMIMNNVITGNSASNNGGGGVECDAASAPTIANNMITANNGGGIDCVYSSATIIVNNTITGNSASGGSYPTGGIRGGASIIINNLVAFNSSGIYANGQYVVLKNNCVWNPDGYNYLGVSAGTGDISVDPKLVCSAYGKVHIQPDSPCINAGDDSAVQAGWLDMDSQSRVQGLHVDIGADESDGTAYTFAPLIIRVSPAGDDSNDGSTWAFAKRTVQSGANAAASTGGEVWVAASTYNERIVLPRYVYLYGGFAGTETSRNERNWMTNVTVLDGAGGGSVVTSTASGFSLSCIDGFTIRNGSAANGGGISFSCSSPKIVNNTITGNSATTYGGGVYCSSASPMISNNTITGNRSTNNGGGISCSLSVATIADTTITENTAISGGGIYCSASWLIIKSGVISKNIASSSGGGIFCYNASATITDSTIAGNRAEGGGGIDCYNSSATIANSMIAGNSATYGGGIACSSYSPTITNNTITGNSAAYGAAIYCSDVSAVITSNTITANDGTYGGIYCRNSYPSSLKVTNNIIAFGTSGLYCLSETPVLKNNCVYGNTSYNYSGLSAGTGDISADPLFVNRAGGDYHLTAASPCINKGLNTAIRLPIFDFDGEGRIFGGTVDIGADEYWSSVFSTKETKNAPEDAVIKLSASTVSGGFTDFFYIEADDRSGGIRVDKAGYQADEDSKVSITGKVKTNIGGERYIAAETILPATGTQSIKPMLLSGKDLGGGEIGLQDGVWTKTWFKDQNGVLQPTWVESVGVNNIGLLVSEIGYVTFAGTEFFYLDDGSKMDDESGHIGVKVMATGLTFPSSGMVKVTGIVSCEKNGDKLVRLLKIRKQTDILPL